MNYFYYNTHTYQFFLLTTRNISDIVSLAMSNPNYVTGSFYIIVSFGEATSVELMQILATQGVEAGLEHCRQWDFDPTEEDNRNFVGRSLYVGGNKTFEKDGYVLVFSDVKGDEWAALYRRKKEK